MSTGCYNYEDKNSIIKAKAKNNHFLFRLLEENQ